MDVVLFIIAALTAGAPMIAAVIVSVASKREDKEWTLGEPDVGPMRTIARRILDFHTDDTELPQPRSRSKARVASKTRSPSLDPEIDAGREPAEAESGWIVLASR